MLSTTDVQKLADLLKTNKDDESESDDDLPKSGFARIGPGDIGPSRKVEHSSSANMKDKKLDVSVEKQNDEEGALEDEKAIWRPEEVSEVDELHDPREQPQYRFSYRQAVGAEDVFLQLGARTPMSASCEDLVVEVCLPGEQHADVDVSLEPRHLDVRSPRYRLSLALPQPVLPDSSVASWSADQHALTLRMRMAREYDYVNF